MGCLGSEWPAVHGWVKTSALPPVRLRRPPSAMWLRPWLAALCRMVALAKPSPALDLACIYKRFHVDDTDFPFDAGSQGFFFVDIFDAVDMSATPQRRALRAGARPGPEPREPFPSVTDAHAWLRRLPVHGLFPSSILSRAFLASRRRRQALQRVRRLP